MFPVWYVGNKRVLDKIDIYDDIDFFFVRMLVFIATEWPVVSFIIQNCSEE